MVAQTGDGAREEEGEGRHRERCQVPTLELLFPPLQKPDPECPQDSPPSPAASPENTPCPSDSSPMGLSTAGIPKRLTGEDTWPPPSSPHLDFCTGRLPHASPDRNIVVKRLASPAIDCVALGWPLACLSSGCVLCQHLQHRHVGRGKG